MLDMEEIAREFAAYSSASDTIAEVLEERRATALAKRRSRFQALAPVDRRRIYAAKRARDREIYDNLRRERRCLEWCGNCVSFHDLPRCKLNEKCAECAGLAYYVVVPPVREIRKGKHFYEGAHVFLCYACGNAREEGKEGDVRGSLPRGRVRRVFGRGERREESK